MKTHRILVAAASVMAVACTSLRDEPAESDDALSVTTANEWVALWSEVKARVVDGFTFDGKWTNWYRNGRAIGLIKLGLMREQLEQHQLASSYAGAGVPESDAHCTDSDRYARRLDGTCNDLSRPGVGRANSRFGRNFAQAHVGAYVDARIADQLRAAGVAPESATDDARAQAWDRYVMSPNPRDVSRRLLARRTDGGAPQMIPFTAMNQISAAWVQFVIHDWYSHGDPRPDTTWSVPLDASDPLRAKGLAFMIVPRVNHDRALAGDVHGMMFQSEVTHWWDGSQLYGSSAEAHRPLRVGEGGLLKEADGGLLPVDSQGIELAGVTRNWWLGLSLLHNLFVREHNAVARALKARYPSGHPTTGPWTDQSLFDTARLVTAALIAKVHTLDFTPAITDHPTMRLGGRANWYGVINPKRRASGEWQRTAKRMLDSLPLKGHELSAILFGAMGNNQYDANVVHAMTEEFAATYRMHPVLPEVIPLVDARTGEVRGQIPAWDTRNARAAELKRQHGVEDLFASFGAMPSGALVLHNFPSWLQDVNVSLFGDRVKVFEHMDVGTIELLRDRERGVPRYNELRRLIGLKPFGTFEEFASPEDAADLRAVYGDDIESVDTMVGIFAEKRHPAHPSTPESELDRSERHILYSETSFQLFMLMASRRLMTDRFFSEGYTERAYTEFGLAWIDCAGAFANPGATPGELECANADVGDLKTLLVRHYPELAASNLRYVDNAFRRWSPDGAPADDRITDGPVHPGRENPNDDTK